MSKAGDRVRFIRLHAGDSIRKAARKLGVHPKLLKKIESGKCPVEKWFIKLLCYEYLFYEEWVQSGKGEMSPLPEFRGSSDAEKSGNGRKKGLPIDEVEELGEESGKKYRKDVDPERFFLQMVLSTFTAGALLFLFRFFLELIKRI